MTFAVLVTFALFVLPQPGAVGTAWLYSSIATFLLLVLTWSGNVLADKDKPEILKLAVSLALIAVLAWLFYRYSGAQWEKLTEFFFNFPKLKGNWWILRDWLGVTPMLAVISAAGSILVGLAVAVLRAYQSRTLDLFLKIYVDVFRSAPMIVIMVVRAVPNGDERDKDVANATSDSVTGLSPKTAYYYRVRAANGSGKGDNSNIVSVTTLLKPPHPPSAFVAIKARSLRPRDRGHRS